MHTTSRWLGLALFAVAVLVVGLDLTILAVALPTLATQLHASQSDLQWFSTAFMLTLAAGMLPAGVVGDRFGRRRTIVGALLVFGAGSVLCALSQTPGQLIGARALMGGAAAAIAVVTLAMVAVVFPVQERAKAVGIMMGATFLGMPLGPIAGGWLLTHAWWGWVFLINVPVAVVAAVGIRATVPETRPERRGPVDLAGMVAFVAGLTGLTYGFVRAGSGGWGDVAAWCWMLAGLAVLLGFAGWEIRVAAAGREPIIPPSLFQVRGFTPGTIVPTLGVMALTGMLFLLPQYFQAIQGQDAMGSGVRLLAVIAGFAPAAALTDLASRRLGSNLAAAAGYVLVAAGLAVAAQTTLASGAAGLLVGSGVLGFGLGLGLSTSAGVALSHIHPDQANTASAVFQALQKTGSPLGVAVLGSVFNQAYLQHLHLPASLPPELAAAVRQGVFEGLGVAAQVPGLTVPVQEAFLDGMRTTMWVCAVAAVATAVLAAITLPRRTPHTAVPVPQVPGGVAEVAEPADYVDPADGPGRPAQLSRSAGAARPGPRPALTGRVRPGVGRHRT